MSPSPSPEVARREERLPLRRYFLPRTLVVVAYLPTPAVHLWFPRWQSHCLPLRFQGSAPISTATAHDRDCLDADTPPVAAGRGHLLPGAHRERSFHR